MEVVLIKIKSDVQLQSDEAFEHLWNYTVDNFFNVLWMDRDNVGTKGSTFLFLECLDAKTRF